MTLKRMRKMNQKNNNKELFFWIWISGVWTGIAISIILIKFVS